ncbi:bifunctional RNase H/acid phosphatase [Streptomyces sp. NBC_00091]|uniref:bifunctional RNase H/acid phosphatase n=1 Tax=Streptomyces sp. NBC_00091 TaxID=2975648 RepID=UPI002259AB5A|nr:bifunctional RNase H/acid phosphatase [Streptomyces sp. NBC_00091]MCX5378613.1 bifunctional RNase H/acid phosphatase [Streptomyces sp. NBC_00091]
MPRFVVEADGGSRGNPGPAGYGAVVLDPATGETLAERAEFIGVATNNVAEYKGLIAGLRAARELAPDAMVRVRMDSKLVVEQMSGRWKIKHPDMKPLAAEAATILPRAQVTYEWIPREKNKHADRLANEAMDAGKRGKQWEPSASTADLAPAGPPGDAAKGAAAVRAALASGGGTGTRAAATADVSAARSAAAAGGDTLFGEAEPTLAPGRIPAPAAGSGAAPAAAGNGTGWGGPDMGTPATFVLLRHGETALTPQKRFSGSGGTDPELSPAGRRQAAAVAEALAARGTVQAVVSSPLLRCRETAQAVADRLGLPVTVEEGLRETDFGAWEGLTFAEVRERFPDDLQAWLDSPKAAPTGGGESFTAVTRRVSAARDRLLSAHAGRTVLLVTHVTPVKTLVRLALGAPPEALFRMELSAASLSAVAYYADGNASVRLLNDTSHLR